MGSMMNCRKVAAVIAGRAAGSCCLSTAAILPRAHVVGEIVSVRYIPKKIMIIELYIADILNIYCFR